MLKDTERSSKATTLPLANKSEEPSYNEDGSKNLHDLEEVCYFVDHNTEIL